MAFAWLAGNAAPSQAAPQGASASSAKPFALGKFTKHRKKHVRHHARSSKKHQASAKAPSRPGKDDNTEPTTEAEADASLPPSVANARAELTSPPPEQPMFAQNMMPGSSTLTDTDKAATAEPAPSGVEVTTSDQLNDMDRDAAAPATPPEPTTVALAQIAQPAAASVSNDSAWSGASLIGKIFIAFGLMLTLVSAARMLWPQRAT